MKYLIYVGQGYDLACLEEDRIAYTLGRHTNDYMTSFYAKTPSGFFIESGWGGRIYNCYSLTVENQPIVFYFCKFCSKSPTICKKIRKIFRKFGSFLAFLRFRDCSHQKERKKCCKMTPWTLKNSSIQPRTRQLKFCKIR